jgi:hypothetical protein
MPTLSRTSLLKLCPAIAVLALALPSAAFGQATRTWVSGVGDDVNPCSRTAPCKTFAGAISKTAAGGIIMALDDAGFGTLTITKPITVDGGHHSAGVLSSGGINGMNINIDPAVQPANFVNNGRVVLKNLKFEGNTSIPSAGGFTPGLNGIRITNAKSVKLLNNDIGYYSRSGISIEPNANTTVKVIAKNNQIHDNGGNGVNIAPLNLANAKVGLRNNDIDDNGCGIVATTFGMTNVFATNCGTADSASGISGRATVNAYENGLAENDNIGIFARGNKATVRIGQNQVSGSTTGLLAMDVGVTMLTYSNNMVSGNGTDGGSTGNVGFLKRGR